MKFSDSIRAFWAEEDGVGVIEIVLILVVLIGLVLIFKKQINTLLENIFKQINSKSKEKNKKKIINRTESFERKVPVETRPS